MRALRLAVVVFLSGCALTSKATPFDIREFTPDATGPARPSESLVTADGAELRIGRIRSTANLRRHIVYRVSEVEVGEYPGWQWTENPEEYVRRGVTRALFEQRGLAQTVSGPHPTLDLELTAFEEVRRGSARLGRVQVSFVLFDGHHVLDSGEVTVERPAEDAEIGSVVVAVSEALGLATNQLADRVAAKLADREKPAPATTPTAPAASP